MGDRLAVLTTRVHRARSRTKRPVAALSVRLAIRVAASRHSRRIVCLSAAVLTAVVADTRDQQQFVFSIHFVVRHMLHSGLAVY